LRKIYAFREKKEFKLREIFQLKKAALSTSPTKEYVHFLELLF
jgi:hypothetical protein